jgi:hypothetical protein
MLYMMDILKMTRMLKINVCLSDLTERENRLKYIIIYLIKIQFGCFIQWNIGIFITNILKISRRNYA